MRRWPAAAFVAAFLALPLQARANSDGPPPGHDGGPGRPDCRACHFDAALNRAEGAFVLSGLPPSYRFGQTYKLRLTLSDPAMVLAGFQLSARFAGGGNESAGTLGAVTGDVDAVGDADSGPAYLQHNAPRVAEDNAVAWDVEWTAPESGGEVTFSAAANAANGDDSELGDAVYALRARAVPR